VLEVGSSEPWQEAMKIMTGGETDKIDAKPILEYFEPLLIWLKQQTKSEFIGWRSDYPLVCPGAEDLQ
jgi:peptidyl-dipeptidase A